MELQQQICGSFSNKFVNLVDGCVEMFHGILLNFSRRAKEEAILVDVDEGKSKLEAQNTNFELDRDQRKDDADNLVYERTC
ncbi:hypothetical protein Patl1_19798 [Pistacia atlantica]|uniref:Uncharacterized protein n=1 Tax=Pistacia atlantica TaxID=434234 RepID=A0ACC1BNH4_9ROSI|nr:hypothetical protein Patl1_19798 [Pistacia atlantica]